MLDMDTSVVKTEHREEDEEWEDQVNNDELPENGSKSPSFTIEKNKFLSEMRDSIRSTINECIAVLFQDPREYHPYYLRVFKYITIGQHHGYIPKSEKSTFKIWNSYDQYAVNRYRTFKDKPLSFQFKGEHSPYLKCLMEGTMVIDGVTIKQENMDRRDMEETFKELESIVDEIRSKLVEKRFWGTLKERLEFFDKCKSVTYPGDVKRMNELWTQLLKQDKNDDVEKPKNKRKMAPPPATQSETSQKRKRKTKVEVREDPDDDEDEDDDIDYTGSEGEDEDYKPDSKEDNDSKSKTSGVSGRSKSIGRRSKLDDMIGRFSAKHPPEVLMQKVEDYKKRCRERHRNKLKNMTNEEKAEIRERQKFCRIERKIQEAQLTPEEREAKKNERFLKRMGYFASIPKEVMEERKRRLKEKRKKWTEMPEEQKKKLREKNRERNMKEEIKAKICQRNREWRKSLTGEALERYKESVRRGIRKYQEKTKKQNPEKVRERTKEYARRAYENQKEKLANMPEEEREEKLLRRRINMKRRWTRKKMEKEGGWTEEDILRRLEQVEEDLRRESRLRLMNLDRSGGESKSREAVKMNKQTEIWEEMAPSSGSSNSAQGTAQIRKRGRPPLKRPNLIPRAPPPPIIQSSSPPSIDISVKLDEEVPTGFEPLASSFAASTSSSFAFQPQPPPTTSCHSFTSSFEPPDEPPSSPPPDISDDNFDDDYKYGDGGGGYEDDTSISPPSLVPETATNTVSMIQDDQINPKTYWLNTTGSSNSSDVQMQIKNTVMATNQPLIKGKVKPALSPLSSTIKKSQKNRGTDSFNVCPECGKSFRQKCTLDDHIRRVHQGKAHICPICSSDLQSAAKLWRHQVERHDMKNLPPPLGVSMVNCEFCSEIVMRGYPQHIRKNHPEHIDKIKNIKIPSKYEIVIDPQTGLERLKCPHCPVLISNNYRMKVHLKRMHADFMVKKGELKSCFPCPHCEFTFPSTYKLATHFYTKHKFHNILEKLKEKNLISSSKSESKSNSYKKMMSCLLCKFESRSKADIRYHFIQSHSDLLINDQDIMSLPMASCPICQENFPSHDKLKEHFKVEHKDNILRCQYCGDENISQLELEDHEENKHVRIMKNEASGICFICKKAFENDVEGLREHVRKQHPGSYFSCQFCNKLHYFESDLVGHIGNCSSVQGKDMKEERRKFLAEIGDDPVKIFMREKLRTLRVHCEICDVITQFRGLKKHFHKFHPGRDVEKSVTTCEQCGVQCRKKTFYVAHSHIVHNIPLKELLKIADENQKQSHNEMKRRKEGTSVKRRKGGKSVKRRKNKYDESEEEDEVKYEEDESEQMTTDQSSSDSEEEHSPPPTRKIISSLLSRKRKAPPPKSARLRERQRKLGIERRRRTLRTTKKKDSHKNAAPALDLDQGLSYYGERWRALSRPSNGTGPEMGK